MVHRTYAGLGDRSAAVREFERFTAWASHLLDLQWGCEPFAADDLAFAIALDGLETAAFHFTRRRAFFDPLRAARPDRVRGLNRTLARAEAVAGLIALDPYHQALRRLQDRCRPFGGDYLALGIAVAGLDTCARHFTGEDGFFAARQDSAGPTRPPRAG